MEIISIERAQREELTYFFTGIPCNHGHIAGRYTKGNRACSECIKARSSATYEKNKEQVSEDNKARNARRMLELHGDRENQVFPKTREEANNLDLIFFDTGVPCIHDHLSKRYAKTGRCKECADETKRKDMLKNGDQRKAARRKYELDNKEAREKARKVRRLNLRKGDIEKTQRIEQHQLDNKEDIEYNMYDQFNRKVKIDIVLRKHALLLELGHYYVDKRCPSGHNTLRTIGGKCVDCIKDFRQSDSYKETKRKHRSTEKYRLTTAIYEQKPEVKQRRTESRGRRRESINAKSREYYAETSEYQSERKRLWYLENPCITFIRGTLQRIERAIGTERKDKATRILGYSQEDFIAHIEKYWEEGMTWENRADWHIDHIIPLIFFVDNGIIDVTIINALYNLRPIWAEDNMSKGSKIDNYDLMNFQDYVFQDYVFHDTTGIEPETVEAFDNAVNHQLNPDLYEKPI